MNEIPNRPSEKEFKTPRRDRDREIGVKGGREKWVKGETDIEQRWNALVKRIRLRKKKGGN